MLQILVVEDDDALREIIATILEEEGHKVIAVATGKAGILAVNNSTELLVSDWQLPDLNGDEVLRHIRTRFPHIPCILSSAQTRAAQFATIIEHTVFLQKPYGIDDLLQLLESFTTESAHS